MWTADHFSLVMLRHVCDVTFVARGPSGRFVIDLEPETKRSLHAALVQDQLTLKEWFRIRVNAYLAERLQPHLPGLASSPEASSAKPKSGKSKV